MDTEIDITEEDTFVALKRPSGMDMIAMATQHWHHIMKFQYVLSYGDKLDLYIQYIKDNGWKYSEFIKFGQDNDGRR